MSYPSEMQQQPFSFHFTGNTFWLCIFEALWEWAKKSSLSLLSLLTLLWGREIIKSCADLCQKCVSSQSFHDFWVYFPQRRTQKHYAVIYQTVVVSFISVALLSLSVIKVLRTCWFIRDKWDELFLFYAITKLLKQIFSKDLLCVLKQRNLREVSDLFSLAFHLFCFPFWHHVSHVLFY